MKKIVLLVFCLLLFVAFVSCDMTCSHLDVNDDAFCDKCSTMMATDEGVVYQISDDGNYAQVVDYEGEATKVVIAEEYQGLPVKSIAENAFRDERISRLFLPDGITNIGACAFFNCHRLISIIIPDSVTSIGESAFFGCADLESLTLPFVGEKINSDSKLYPLGYIFGTSSYMGGIATEQVYLDLNTNETTEITYYIPERLQSITITGERISFGAFKNCTNLSEIIIGNKVSSIDKGAFYQCKGLTNITIPDNVMRIEDWAFFECDNLTTVYFGKNLTSIGNEAFSSCYNLANIYVDEENPTYKSKNGILYNKSETNLLQYPIARQDAHFVVPDGVTMIGTAAFAECKYLTSIIMPESLRTISENAFRKCTALSNVNFSNGLISIGSSAFSGCISLTSIRIPESMMNIGMYAFSGCYKLVEVINCSSLSISKGTSYYGGIASDAKVVHSGQSKIETQNNYLFLASDGVNYLLGYVGEEKELTLPETYNSETYEIYQYAFSGREDIISVHLSDSVNRIHESAFKLCINLVSVTIPYSVISIEDGAFYGCEKLTSISIPEGFLKEIDLYAFYGCSSLTSISIPSCVDYVSDLAFMACPIEMVTAPASIISKIPKEKLKQVIINSGNQLSYSTLKSCTELTSIVIPSSVTSIDATTFKDCRNMIKIYYCGTSKQWDAIKKENYWDSYLGAYTITFNVVIE